MSAKVLLHVGTPKTGTSYLQDVLFQNRTILREHGISYPAPRFDAQFLAALDLIQMPWGGLEKEAGGSWDTLARKVRDWPGTSIISHEILARASAEQVQRAMASFGDAEVHLLISARDLVRQIPAEWQENVKHRRTFSYSRFLEVIRDPARDSKVGSWFWAVQELPDILTRWGAGLPAERVHVITVPQPGAPRSELWDRFVRAFGLDGVPLQIHDDRANASLGVPETALLRRINAAVNDVLPPDDYRPLVRELLAHNTLSRRTGSPRLSVPPEVAEWATELGAAWVDELRSRGYDVIGDLADLVPSAATLPFVDPDHPRERMVNQAAVDVIRALLLENARLMHTESRLHHELRSKTATTVAKEQLVRRLEGGRLLQVYRRLRGRNSRSA